MNNISVRPFVRRRPLPKVYLAEKMSIDHDWRGEASTLGRQVRDGIFYDDWQDPNVWVANARPAGLCGVPFVYVGPFPASCDHGCAHSGESLHMAETCADDMSQRDIVRAALRAIRACNIVCAHISTPDAYGTLAELGFAAGIGKQISVTVDQCLGLRTTPPSDPDDLALCAIGAHDFWFAQVNGGRS